VRRWIVEDGAREHLFPLRALKLRAGALALEEDGFRK
jgi:hypothetical protein